MSLPFGATKLTNTVVNKENNNAACGDFENLTKVEYRYAQLSYFRYFSYGYIVSIERFI